jgi:hypothetical protein
MTLNSVQPKRKALFEKNLKNLICGSRQSSEQFGNASPGDPLMILY